jgi:hypothetical protein
MMIEPNRDEEALAGCVFMILSTLFCCVGFILGFAIKLMMR